MHMGHMDDVISWAPWILGHSLCRPPAGAALQAHAWREAAALPAAVAKAEAEKKEAILCVSRDESGAGQGAARPRRPRGFRQRDAHHESMTGSMPRSW